MGVIIINEAEWLLFHDSLGKVFQKNVLKFPESFCLACTTVFACVGKNDCHKMSLLIKYEPASKGKASTFSHYICSDMI